MIKARMAWKRAALGAAALILCAAGASAGTDTPPPPFDVMKPAIDVGLVVSDEAKAAEFYGGAIGLKAGGSINLPDGGKMLRFQAGSTTVKLIVLPTAPPTHPGGIQKGIGLRLLTLYFRELDPIVENFAKKGLPKPQVLGAPGAGRLIFCFDPDGNQIELIEVGKDAEQGAEDRAMVGITVNDVEKSREFYGKILGLHELDPVPLFGKSGPTKYQFKLGKTGVKFWKFEGKDLPVVTGKYDAAVGIRYFTFMVKDVDAVHELLKSRGAPIAQPPTDFGKLARVMFATDPDGNWIEFAAMQKPMKKAGP